jgi:hypothetical protein
VVGNPMIPSTPAIVDLRDAPGIDADYQIRN